METMKICGRSSAAMRRLGSTGGATPAARPTLDRFTGRQLGDSSNGGCAQPVISQASSSSTKGSFKTVAALTALGLLVLSAVQIGLAAMQMHMAWQDWKRHMSACEGSEQEYCSETALDLMAAEFYIELAMLVYMSGAVVVDIVRFVVGSAYLGTMGERFGTLGRIITTTQYSSLYYYGSAIFKWVFGVAGAVGLIISIINEIQRGKRDQDFGELVRHDLMQQSGLF